MKLLSANIYNEDDLAYFKLIEASAPVRTSEVTDFVHVDFNPDGQLQSVEVICLTEFSKAKDALISIGVPSELVTEMQRYIDVALDSISA